MKSFLTICSLIVLLSSCDHKNPLAANDKDAASLEGTWQLITSQTITKGDTVTTFPIKNQEMVKIFTDNQFAFFKHDINKGQGENAIFESGTGTYKLNGESYTEHLAFCSARGWENQDFSFKMEIKKDTIIQRGIEKIDSLNIDHEIVEIYKKINRR